MFNSSSSTNNLLAKSKYVVQSKFGKLDSLLIEHPKCSAHLSLFGAHTLSFIPTKDEQERLFVSTKTQKDGTKAIRGGIPICWPWFASNEPDTVTSFGVNNKISPSSHGYVRTQDWQLASLEETRDCVTLRLVPSSLGKFGYSQDFRVYLEFHFADTLRIDLITLNDSEENYQFGCALHTYFLVDNIERVCIKGIASDYLDKTQNFALAKSKLPYLIESEVDRIHPKELSTKEDSILITGVSNKLEQVKIEHEGNNATVIWNPWTDLSKSMPDLENDGYKKMLCIESAIVEPIVLGPSQSHILRQVIY